VWDADKKPSPLVQRFVDPDGHRIDDVVWISGTQFALYSKDQNDGIIRICQIGREHPIMSFVHGVSHVIASYIRIEFNQNSSGFNQFRAMEQSTESTCLCFIF
jgi:hypothetical protein